MKLNIYFIQEWLEITLSQIGYFYEPTKANNKRIIDFFESFPFFFFNLTFQNEIYTIIKKRPITSYYDSNENMKTFCYLIYKDFNIKYNIPVKTQEEFYANLRYQLHHETSKYKQWKKNNIHTYIFILMIIALGGIYYYIQLKF